MLSENAAGSTPGGVGGCSQTEVSRQLLEPLTGIVSSEIGKDRTTQGRVTATEGRDADRIT